jgi:hypothetical protein
MLVNLLNPEIIQGTRPTGSRRFSPNISSYHQFEQQQILDIPIGCTAVIFKDFRTNGDDVLTHR